MEEVFEPQGLRLLHKACREGTLLTVINLAQSMAFAVLNMRSVVTGRTAMHEACANGHRDAVEQLLNLGADDHTTTYLGADTPLHLAVASGSRPLIFLLLRRGCDPNAQNKFGRTCFHLAGEKPSIVKLLLRHGGRANIRDVSGKTPRDCVHEGCPGNQDIMRLVELAYDVEERKRLEHAFKAVKREEDLLRAKKREKNAKAEPGGDTHGSATSLVNGMRGKQR